MINAGKGGRLRPQLLAGGQSVVNVVPIHDFRGDVLLAVFVPTAKNDARDALAELFLQDDRADLIADFRNRDNGEAQFRIGPVVGGAERFGLGGLIGDRAEEIFGAVEEVGFEYGRRFHDPPARQQHSLPHLSTRHTTARISF